MDGPPKKWIAPSFPPMTHLNDAVSQGLLKDVGDEPATWLQNNDVLMTILRRSRGKEADSHIIQKL